MRRFLALLAVLLVLGGAWAALFGVGSRGGVVLWPNRIQLFERDRVLVVSDPNSSDVFILHPLSDTLTAQFKKWLSTDNFVLREIWVNADTIHNAYLDQKEHKDILDFGVIGWPTNETIEHFSYYTGTDAVSFSLGGDDLPYGLCHLVSASALSKLTTCPPDLDISTHGRLRYSTHFMTHLSNKPTGYQGP